jgi:hypothetical protein
MPLHCTAQPSSASRSAVFSIKSTFFCWGPRPVLPCLHGCVLLLIITNKSSCSSLSSIVEQLCFVLMHVMGS